MRDADESLHLRQVKPLFVGRSEQADSLCTVQEFTTRTLHALFRKMVGKALVATAAFSDC